MKNNPIICIGATLVDESFSCIENPINGTSNPAEYFRSPGGVAHNISRHLALLGHHVELITHFGNDTDGDWLMQKCKSGGVGISHSLINLSSTGRYVAILSPTGDLFAGAVTTSFENEITPEFLNNKKRFLKTASLLQIDCNLSTSALDWLIQFSREENIPCIIEPVSISKASRLQNVDLKDVLLITPNLDEMNALTGSNKNNNLATAIQQLLNRGVKYLWVRKGKNGSEIYSSVDRFELAAPDVNVIDSTGAGDASLAGWIHAWIMKNNPENCLRYGHALASLVLQTKGAIQQKLTKDILEISFDKIN